MTRKKTKTGTGLMTPKAKVNLSLTDKAITTLETMAKETGLTKSALFESILTGNISVSSHNSSQVLNVYLKNEDAEDLTVQTTTEINIAQSDNDQANKIINDQLEGQKKVIQNLEEEVNKQKTLLSEKEAKIINLQSELQKERENKSSSVNERELTDLTKEIGALKEIVKEKEEEIKKLLGIQNLLDEKMKIIEELNGKISNLEEQLAHSGDSESLQAKLVEIENQAQKAQLQLDNLQSELTSKNNQIVTLNQQLSNQENTIEQLHKQIHCQQEMINQLQNERYQLKSNYEREKGSLERELKAINEQQKITINHLQKRVAELETVANVGEQTLNKWRFKIYN